MNKSSKVSPAHLLSQLGSPFEEIKERKPPVNQTGPEETEQFASDEVGKFLRQKEILQAQEQLIYDRRKKETEEEIALVRQNVEKIATQPGVSPPDEELDRAIAQPTITPSRYELSFWQHLKSIIRTKVNDASSWLGEFNNRKRKRRDFWGIVSDKKRGGSQFLLSSEHYVSRSAG